jgi:hypothetical protein
VLNVRSISSFNGYFFYTANTTWETSIKPNETNDARQPQNIGKKVLCAWWFLLATSDYRVMEFRFRAGM